MNNKTYTIKEISNTLGIHANTIRQWESILNLNIPRDRKNCRVYDDTLLETLRKIKELRESETDFNTIIDNLQLTLQSEPVNLTVKLTETIRNEVCKAIVDNNEISKDYAKVTYKLGQLESEKKALEEKIKLLPAPEEINHLKIELITLKTKNESLEKENEFLKTPFWKRFFFNFQYRQA